MKPHSGYFALSPALNPLYLLDRRMNPTRHLQVVNFRGRGVTIRWTERARQALAERDLPLIVEMQLLFSCVVKKRVIFHEQTDLPTLPVNDRLRIAFRAVQSAACDPVEFARLYPVARELNSAAARKMRPRWLALDYRKGRFQAEFGL
ncbi:MAG: hypothetical protein Kow006_22850 [Gammaproteobacteria bacterium]